MTVEKGVSKCRYDVRREPSVGNTGKKTTEARVKGGANCVVTLCLRELRVRWGHSVG